MNHVNIPTKRYVPGKILATVFVVGPLAMMVAFWSFVFAAGLLQSISSVRHANDLAYPLLYLLSVLVGWWLVYSMVVSLWLDQRNASTSFGLVLGLIMHSIFGMNGVEDFLKEFNRGYWQAVTVFYTYMFVSAWVLTAGLLLHAMYGRRRD